MTQTPWPSDYALPELPISQDNPTHNISEEITHYGHNADARVLALAARAQRSVLYALARAGQGPQPLIRGNVPKMFNNIQLGSSVVYSAIPTIERLSKFRVRTNVLLKIEQP